MVDNGNRPTTAHRGAVRARISLVAVALLTACSVPIDDSRPPLRVGVSGDYAPFAFGVTDETAGDALDGLDVTIARRFARETGRRITLVRFSWPQLTADLAAGRFDVAMSGVTMRPERTFVGTFTRPVTHSGAVVLARPGLGDAPQDYDRTGIRLAVNRGGHLERITRRLFSHTAIETVDENARLPALLGTGTVDAIVCDRFEALRWLATAPSPLRLRGPFTVDHKAYLARDPALAAELDAWLRSHEEDGSLADLRSEWLGPDDAGRRTGFESDVDALLALIDLRLGFMPFVARAKLAADQPVLDAGQEQQVLAAARDGAAAQGLEARSTVALFSALVAAARAIQEEYLHLPAGRRPAVELADLSRTLRPAIAEVSRAILRTAAVVAREPQALDALPPAALARLLDPVLTPAPHRRAIADAVRNLRLDPAGSPAPSDR